MRKVYRRPYTIAQQEEFNAKLCDSINDYWREKGYEAQARTESKQVYVGPGNGRKEGNCRSVEIVSSVSSFPPIRRQVLGIL